MPSRFRSLIICLLAASTAVSLQADDANYIKAKLPFATGMAYKDCRKLATSGKAPDEADFEDKSMTLMLLVEAHRQGYRRTKTGLPVLDAGVS